MNIDEILKYEWLVYSIINKFEFYQSKEDLYQAGMKALAEALKNYKETTAKFSTYAYKYILGEVTKLIREDRSIKVSRDFIKINKIVEQTRDLLRQKLSREPTDIEISLIIDIDVDKIEEARQALVYVKSLDYIDSEEDTTSYYNSVRTYDKETNPDIQDLKDEISKLNEEEQKLIYYRYYAGYTQSELSKVLNTSQVQISRKENKVLEKLKVRL